MPKPKKKKTKKKRKNSPEKIKPMLATLASGPFDSEEFIFEIKWDGYRALASVEDGEVELYSRNLKDFNHKYPAIVDKLRKVRVSVLFDGEIIAYNKDGLPSFQALQNIDTENAQLQYVIFDLLYLNGKNIMNEDLIVRKSKLQKLLAKYPDLTYSEHIERRGKEMFRSAVANKLEGIMGKHKASKYIPDYRSELWLKIKHHITDEAIIAGYTRPRGSREYFGALVLGQYKDNDEFSFIGHTGTGFNRQMLETLYKKMKPLIVKKSPFKTKVPLNSPITWVRPKLIAELKFTEWTRSGTMRHPVFLGLREDKSIDEIKKEKIILIKRDLPAGRQEK